MISSIIMENLKQNSSKMIESSKETAWCNNNKENANHHYNNAVNGGRKNGGGGFTKCFLIGSILLINVLLMPTMIYCNSISGQQDSHSINSNKNSINTPIFPTSSLSFTLASLPEKRSSRMQYGFGLGKRQQSSPSSSASSFAPLALSSLSSSQSSSIPSMNEITEIVELPDSSSTSHGSDLLYVIFPMADRSPLQQQQQQQQSSMSSYLLNDDSYLPTAQILFAPFAPGLPLSIESKRSRPERYQFGLGKRSKEQLMFNQRFNDDSQFLDPSLTASSTAIMMNNNADQSLPSSSSSSMIVENKRKMQPYGFGLGKRQPEQQQSRKIKKLTNFDDFIKRRYSFGLGKRSV